VSFQRYILPGCALLIVLAFVTMTRADPDLWGHVRFGADMLDSAAIRVPDTYSFTSDKPWTNHEWLAEIIMAAAYRMAGAAGLVLLKLTVIALSLACVWRIAMGDGARARSAAILTGLALVGILPRAQQVRPQISRCSASRRWSWCCGAPRNAGGALAGAAAARLLGQHPRRMARRMWDARLWCAARTWTMRLGGLRADARTMWSACLAPRHAGQPLRRPGLWSFCPRTVGLSRRFIPEWAWRRAR
jgi:hypothetical protein